MTLVECTLAGHGAAILEILNDSIVNSTSPFEYVPRAPESMGPWFEAKRAGGYPVLGAVDDAGALLGFASYGPFRAWAAYKYSVEHSVYVHRDHRGRGLGRTLMRGLIATAREREMHMMIGGIEATNTGSIALHESLGFTHAGTIRHAGFKFGRWLDLAFYQLLLEGPARPVDG